MRLLLAALLWCLLLVLCWPLAIIFLFAWPLLLILSIPFRIVGAVLDACLRFFGAVLSLPVRLVGGR